ncbi:hypothetical protein [Vibrio sp. D431a]|uniref:hypothetical protein n=1 Tax=Vibrio sp. D431a TaxID=2837388 RepID=UPI00255359F4|nr:hypothetical protein [Vibrio sp. D431a]MDK9790058.1 hypothetical protein [Vibrio sp. D431a]
MFKLQLVGELIKYQGTICNSFLTEGVETSETLGEIFFDDAVNNVISKWELHKDNEVSIAIGYEEYSPDLRASHSSTIKEFTIRHPTNSLSKFVDTLTSHAEEIIFGSLDHAGSVKDMPTEHWFESERYPLPKSINYQCILDSVPAKYANKQCPRIALEIWRQELVYACTFLFELIELSSNLKISTPSVRESILDRLHSSLLTSVALDEVPLEIAA